MPADNSTKVYALLVGINEYRAPITQLQGCLRDINRIEAYLKKQIVEERGLYIQTLTNEEATRSNIIASFRQHLARAKSEDVVWFHFSGHGTESFTAPEFRNSVEPNGKDQNLVCYNISDEDTDFLLADKEIAVLLQQISSSNATPHIIVSLDCCHSGSGTRIAEWEEASIKSRTISSHRFSSYQEAHSAGATRKLSTYLNGYFSLNNLDIPLTKHILLSACTSIQTAGDTLDGGIFTTGLLRAIESSTTPLNYTDLFARTRATVQQQRREQLPQFEIVGGFNPYQQFLSQNPMGSPDHYRVFKEKERWMIACGAIHGLPPMPKQTIQIEIVNKNTPTHLGQIVAVGTQKSRVAFNTAPPHEPDSFFLARIRFLPQPPVTVIFSGDQAAVGRLKKHWQSSATLTLASDTTTTASAPKELEVSASSVSYSIIDHRLGKSVFSISQAPEMEQLVLQSLRKIVRWERTLALANPKSKISNWIDFEMEVLHHSNEKRVFSNPVLEFNTASTAFIQHQGSYILGFLPKVRIKHTTQQLHFYLLHLRSDYSIASYEGECVFRPGEFTGQNSVELPLLKSHKGWGLGPEDDQTTSYFQLFVTTEELDYQQFLQSGLGGERATNWNWSPVGVKDDWCSLLIKIKLIKS